MNVIDTNILVAGLRSRNGASFRILAAIGRGQVDALASVALVLEYEEVLRRDANLRSFWAAADEVDRVLEMLARRMTPVAISYRWRPQLRDADDEHVLDCAVNGRARRIVTFNRTDFLPAAERFGIDVVRPGEFAKLTGI